MKRLRLLGLLTGLSFTACQHTDPIQPTNAELSGNWAGSYETQQAGSCTWHGEASIPARASYQVSGTTVTGTLSRQYGQSSVSVSLTGTLSGSVVRLS